MRALAAELATAADSRDWPRLQAAAHALPGRMAELARRGPLSPQEENALGQLRAAHAQASGAITGAMLETQMVLDEMHNNKEGWMAYALNEAAPAGNEE